MLNEKKYSNVMTRKSIDTPNEKMRIITNEPGQETFAKEINPIANWCDEVCIVTAFFTDDSLIGAMSESGKDVKLVVSLRPPTNPAALRRVLSKKNVKVKYLGKELHSKVYAFAKGDENSWNEDDFECHAAIGSSNLTQGGFSNNIETNILLSGSLAKDAFNQSRNLFYLANELSPDVLERYTEEFGQYPDLDFPEIHESKERLNEEYQRIMHAVNRIVRLCSDLIKEYFPDVPPYLVVDHFWDYLVVSRRAEKEEIRKRSKGTNGDRVIRDLFLEYIREESEKEHRYPDEMFERSQRLSEYIAKSSLTNDEMEEVFLTFHASRYAENRYTNRVKLFIEKNTSVQVLRSLNYLADESVDIGERLQALQRKPLKLFHFGESSIKEFNGWLYPEKYPIWNTKSERALDILGLG